MASKYATLMVKHLEETFLPTLQKCSTILHLKKTHAHIIKFSLSQSNFLITKMVDICDHNSQIHYANLLFNQVVQPNIYLYNAIVRAHTHNHFYLQSIEIYKEMLRKDRKYCVFPDKFTYPFVIKSCIGLVRDHMGFQVHTHVWKLGLNSNCVIGNSFIDFYAKCGGLKDAHQVFDAMTDRDCISWNSLVSGYVRVGQMKMARVLFEEMPAKSIVSWTAMISGFTQIGGFGDALDVFRRMQEVGIEPDLISILAVLPACAQVGALEVGKWIHFYADKNGFLRKTSVCNALVEMYAKCGRIDQARQVFDGIGKKDVISWSTMIAGLANHGQAGEGIELFEEMKRGNVEPNEITFLAILSTCAHAGFLNEGLKYFDSMSESFGIDPEIEHYGCLIDLLGRCGCFDKALEFIRNMPMKPDSKIWGSLLSSCRTRSNLEIAIIAMENLEELEPNDTGNYVLLSNIYADLGKWEGVSKMRKLIRSKKMKKVPGCSLIEIDNMVQEFVSGDDSKPFSDDIYWVLELLVLHQSKSDNGYDIVEMIME